MFWNPQDPPRQSRSVALILPAILAVSKVTSSAASNDVANLEAGAGTEVTETDRFNN